MMRGSTLKIDRFAREGALFTGCVTTGLEIHSGRDG
jgi:hypothetical protein